MREGEICGNVVQTTQRGGRKHKEDGGKTIKEKILREGGASHAEQAVSENHQGREGRE